MAQAIRATAKARIALLLAAVMLMVCVAAPTAQGHASAAMKTNLCNGASLTKHWSDSENLYHYLAFDSRSYWSGGGHYIRNARYYKKNAVNIVYSTRIDIDCWRH